MQKNKHRANLYIDGVFACGLELQTIMQHNLKVGTSITLQELEALQAESEFSKATEYAMGICAKKFYTKHQLVQKLKQKGYLNSCINQVVTKLKEYHIIDDKTFITAYMHSQQNQSKRMILEKLKQQGVSFDMAKEAVNAISLEEEYANALKIAEKYVKTRKGVANMYAKSIQYVCNKGFSYDISKRAVDAVFLQQGDKINETWC